MLKNNPVNVQISTVVCAVPINARQGDRLLIHNGVILGVFVEPAQEQVLERQNMVGSGGFYRSPPQEAATRLGPEMTTSVTPKTELKTLILEALGAYGTLCAREISDKIGYNRKDTRNRCRVGQVIEEMLRKRQIRNTVPNERYGYYILEETDAAPAI